MSNIYLDAAATAKYRNIDDIIVNTMITAMKDSWQNPSSLYASNVKEKIYKCRTNIAEFIGAKANEIYFTSGSSESNNFAIRGWVDNMNKSCLQTPIVITTPIEHKSTLELLKSGVLDAYTYYCDVDEYGFIDNKSLEYLLDSCNGYPILVSVHHGNNEIGTIQMIKQVSDLVHKYNGIIHVDSTQTFGHIPVNVEELDIDMMSCSGHKISPVLRGIGFLYKRNGINIKPLIYGSQEKELRGGTENTYGIIGLNKAIEYRNINRMDIEELCYLRDYFIDLLWLTFGCKINGCTKNRLPNNVNVTFPQNITGEALLYTLDLSGIKVSVGSACNSRSIEPSHVLKEIGLTNEEAMKTVRFTLPDDITYEDIDYVIDEINKAIKIIETN